MSPRGRAPGGPAFVGVDLGTSSIKAVVLDPDGRAIASARRAHPTARPRPGVAEQDPGSWWRGLAGVLAEIGDRVPPAAWRSLGLTAMMPTLLLLDGEHRPVGPAITWQDDRAEPNGTRMRERIGAQALYRRTGQWVDGRYLLPMAEALAARRPRDAARARFLLGAKDYLFHRLTGELWTDPSTAAGYGCYDLTERRWMPGGTGFTLPTIEAADGVAPMRPSAADFLGVPAALPVALGSADSVAGAIALGAREPGATAYLAGSSTVVLAPLPGPRFDPDHRFLVTPTADGVAAEMDLLATGAAQGWLAGLLGPLGPVAAAGPDALGTSGRAPLFLPYLAPGEQGALWDPHLSGSLLGLTLAHGRDDLARALLTGIVVESARCLDVLAETAASRGDVHAGGAAVSDRAARDLADATGRRVLLEERTESHSAVGAAMLAARAVGEAVRPAAAFRVIEPDPAMRAWWDAARQRQDAARRALAGIAPGMTGMRGWQVATVAGDDSAGDDSAGDDSARGDGAR